MFLLAILAVAAVLDYSVFPRLARPGGPSGNIGQNGLWVQDDFYDGDCTQADIHALARRLKAEDVRFAYFEVRGVTRPGNLEDRREASARRLNADMKEEAPSVVRLAWVYIGNSRGEGEVDLADPAVRREIVREAVWLVRDCGFDGIQWDYEICGDGDKPFLALLDETRSALPPAAMISVCSPVWAWSPICSLGFGWSDAYFTQVASRCDQICVMAYDTAMPSPRGYVWLVHQQVVHVGRDAETSRTGCRILIGVPTYPDRTPAHDPHSENLRLALIGVRDGLADSRTARGPIVGVTLFADYTTTQQDWKTYGRLWPLTTR